VVKIFLSEKIKEIRLFQPSLKGIFSLRIVSTRLVQIEIIPSSELTSDQASSTISQPKRKLCRNIQLHDLQLITDTIFDLK